MVETSNIEIVNPKHIIFVHTYPFQKNGVDNMGINIDKNEYYEIILSNSNHPENIIRK